MPVTTTRLRADTAAETVFAGETSTSSQLPGSALDAAELFDR